MAMALLTSSCKQCMRLLSLLLVAMAMDQIAMASLSDDVKLVWGEDHSFFHMDGDEVQTLALCLDETHGSGFHTKDAYLFARFDVDIMLVPNNSAGTVTTLYLMPEDVPWEYHDEVDLEFLGNVTGEPYTLHTNLFANGVGRREEQFRLWFDPTAAFHTYSIEWNPKRITILVDGVPIRNIKNKQAKHGVPFPTWQKMRLHGSLWNADDWATQGGRVKTDWSGAPFFAYYRNLRASSCAPSPGVAWCGDEPPESTRFEQDLDTTALLKAREAHMIYDYCKDAKRYKGSEFPKECTLD